MTVRRRPELPDFLGDDDDSVDLTLLEVLPDLVEPVPPPSSVRHRLLGDVASARYRYAPFVDRLQELWALPEGPVLELLERSGEASAWKRTAIPGVKLIEVPAGKALARATAYLVTFAAGTRYPEHRHHGDERVLVLEGSYIDASGRVVAAGDEHHMTHGSRHGFKIPEEQACVAAVVHHGFRFMSPLLYAAQWLFARDTLRGRP
jgi:quercetin dioxygenase-like cupin family protein